MARSRCTPAASRDARDFARRTIEAFEPPASSASSSTPPGCGSSMKEYERLLADDPAVGGTREGVHPPGSATSTSCSSSSAPPRAPRHPLDLRVAYHDACHLAHAQGIRAAAARSAAADSGRRAGRRSRSRSCAAAAPGSTTWLSRSRRGSLGERKVAHIAAVASRRHRDGQSRMHAAAESVAAEEGTPLRVVHPIELIDESIRGSRSRVAGSRRSQLRADQGISEVLSALLSCGRGPTPAKPARVARARRTGQTLAGRRKL